MDIYSASSITPYGTLSISPSSNANTITFASPIGYIGANPAPLLSTTFTGGNGGTGGAGDSVVIEGDVAAASISATGGSGQSSGTGTNVGGDITFQGSLFSSGTISLTGGAGGTYGTNGAGALTAGGAVNVTGGASGDIVNLTGGSAPGYGIGGTVSVSSGINATTYASIGGGGGSSSHGVTGSSVAVSGPSIITGVTNSTSLLITSGAGYTGGFNASSQGDSGGGATINGDMTVTNGNIVIQASNGGSGGSTAGGVAGGAGGDISVSVGYTLTFGQQMQVTAGNGGLGGGSGSGATGGRGGNVSFGAIDSSTGNISITTGAKGSNNGVSHGGGAGVVIFTDAITFDTTNTYLSATSANGYAGNSGSLVLQGSLNGGSLGNNILELNAVTANIGVSSNSMTITGDVADIGTSATSIINVVDGTNVTFAGNVKTTAALSGATNQLNIGSSTGAQATFQGETTLDAINVTGASFSNPTIFNGNVTVNNITLKSVFTNVKFGGGSSAIGVTGAIDSSSGSHSYGILSVIGNQNVTFNSAIGTTHSIDEIAITSTGQTTFNSTVHTLKDISIGMDLAGNPIVSGTYPTAFMDNLEIENDSLISLSLVDGSQNFVRFYGNVDTQGILTYNTALAFMANGGNRVIGEALADTPIISLDGPNAASNLTTSGVNNIGNYGLPSFTYTSVGALSGNGNNITIYNSMGESALYNINLGFLPLGYLELWTDHQLGSSITITRGFSTTLLDFQVEGSIYIANGTLAPNADYMTYQRGLWNTNLANSNMLTYQRNIQAPLAAGLATDNGTLFYVDGSNTGAASIQLTLPNSVMILVNQQNLEANIQNANNNLTGASVLTVSNSTTALNAPNIIPASNLTFTGSMGAITYFDGSTYNATPGVGGSAIVVGGGNAGDTSTANLGTVSSVSINVIGDGTPPVGGNEFSYYLFSTNGADATITPPAAQNNAVLNFASSNHLVNISWGVDTTAAPANLGANSTGLYRIYSYTTPIDANSAVIVGLSDGGKAALKLLTGDSDTLSLTTAQANGLAANGSVPEFSDAINNVETLVVQPTSELSGIETNDGTAAAITTKIASVGPAGSVIAGDEGEGTAAGSEENTGGVWLGGFIHNARQKSYSNRVGYKVKTGGIILGLDTKVSDNLLIGIAYGRAGSTLKHSEALDKNKSNTTSDVFSLYSLWIVNDSWRIHPQIAYGLMDTKSRMVRYNRLQPTFARASYKSKFYNASVEISRHFAMSPSLTLEPALGLRYFYYDDARYRETAGATNFIVKDRTSYALEGLLGLKLVKRYDYNDWIIKPEISATAHLNIKNKQGAVRVQLADTPGESTFPTTKSSSGWYSAGCGIFLIKGQAELSAGYDLQLDKKYVGHQGTLKVKWNF